MRLDLDRPVGAGGPRLELLMIARHRLRILQHVSREHRDHAVAGPDHALADQPLGPGAFPNAAVLPRLPAGTTIQSGDSQPSCCSSSSTMVFWPSSRNGFTELRR